MSETTADLPEPKFQLGDSVKVLYPWAGGRIATITDGEMWDEPWECYTYVVDNGVIRLEEHELELVERRGWDVAELTPDWLEELHENIKLSRVSPFEALEQLPVLLAHIASQAEETERLRRERDSLVNIAVAALDHVRKRYNGDSDSFGDVEEAFLDAGFTMDDLDAIPGLGQTREDVLALLNSTNSHTTKYRQINNQPDSWECTKCVHSLVDGMSPSEHNASYCPGCGRRIIGEEPWRDDEGSGQS